MAELNKAKKGTPEYEEWLRKYREKRGVKSTSSTPTSNLSDAQASKLQADAVKTGFANLSTTLMHKGKTTPVYIEVIRQDNYFINKPNTYTVNIGSSIHDVDPVASIRTVTTDTLKEIMTDYLSNSDK